MSAVGRPDRWYKQLGITKCEITALQSFLCDEGIMKYSVSFNEIIDKRKG